jgi:hypothetical protein
LVRGPSIGVGIFNDLILQDSIDVSLSMQNADNCKHVVPHNVSTNENPQTTLPAKSEDPSAQDFLRASVPQREDSTAARRCLTLPLLESPTLLPAARGQRTIQIDAQCHLRTTAG